MEMNKNAFLLYNSHIETIKDSSDEEAGKIFKSILRYVNGLDIQLDRNSYEYGIFKGIKTQIDFSTKNWLEKCETNRQNAYKRWGKNKNANACERMHNDIDNENEIDNDYDKGNVVVVDPLQQDINSSTTTNKKNYISKGEFNNVVITQKQYQSCIKQVQDQLPGESKEVCIHFVDKIIDELSSNICEGKAPKFDEYDFTKHSRLLHQYINQKINKLNDIAYNKHYGNFLEQIKQEIAQPEYIF